MSEGVRNALCKVGSTKNETACAWRAASRQIQDSMNETVARYGTVAQYVQMVQQNQVAALAAGVVVHRHTRVLMADQHERGIPYKGITIQRYY